MTSEEILAVEQNAYATAPTTLRVEVERREGLAASHMDERNYHYRADICPGAAAVLDAMRALLETQEGKEQVYIAAEALIRMRALRRELSATRDPKAYSAAMAAAPARASVCGVDVAISYGGDSNNVWRRE